MDIYTPVDNRSVITLNTMISPYINAVVLATSLKDIIDAMFIHLPPQTAADLELRLRMHIRNNKDFSQQKQMAIDLSKKLIELYVCQRLPYFYSDDNKVFYYTREDLVQWYNSNPVFHHFIQQSPPETITVSINYNGIIKTSNISLSKDQLIGICFSLYGLNINHITLSSSLDNQLINPTIIVNSSLLYTTPITTPMNKLQRPYSVDVVQPDKSFRTLHFLNPEFIQGITSVSSWNQLPNNGINVLWKNLTQYTYDGIIDLTF